MNDKKNKLGKAGCITAIAAVVLMFAGILMTCYSVRLGNSGLLVPGVILALLPLIAIPIMAMLPTKLRGVDEVPRRERAVQLFMLLIMVMLFAGFLTGFIMVMTSPGDNTDVTPIIISGGVAAVGFIGVIVTAAVNKRVTGKDTVTVQLFPEDEKSREMTEKILDKVLKPENRLSAEERERELDRIEKNTVGAMTKEQVEEYENRKHGIR